MIIRRKQKKKPKQRVFRERPRKKGRQIDSHRILYRHFSFRVDCRTSGRRPTGPKLRPMAGLAARRIQCRCNDGRRRTRAELEPAALAGSFTSRSHSEVSAGTPDFFQLFCFEFGQTSERDEFCNRPDFLRTDFLMAGCCNSDSSFFVNFMVDQFCQTYIFSRQCEISILHN